MMSHNALFAFESGFGLLAFVAAFAVLWVAFPRTATSPAPASTTTSAPDADTAVMPVHNVQRRYIWALVAWVPVWLLLAVVWSAMRLTPEHPSGLNYGWAFWVMLAIGFVLVLAPYTAGIVWLTGLGLTIAAFYVVPWFGPGGSVLQISPVLKLLLAGLLVLTMSIILIVRAVRRGSGRAAVAIGVFVTLALCAGFATAISFPGGSAASASTPEKPALEDPGPNACLPGKQILADLRTKKPLQNEDFKAPYDAAELNALATAEITWVSQNETKPCVVALAKSFNVPKLGDYMHDNLVLGVAGDGNVTVLNTYFAKKDGEPKGAKLGDIIDWKVQTFPAGELVWFSKDGTPGMKFVCGNRLKPPPTPPSGSPAPACSPSKKHPCSTTTTQPPCNNGCTTTQPPCTKCTTTPPPSSCVPTSGQESCGKNASYAPPPPGGAPVVQCPSGQHVPRGGTQCVPDSTPAPAPTPTNGGGSGNGSNPGQGDSGPGAGNTTSPPVPPTTPPAPPVTSAPPTNAPKPPAG